MAYREFNDGSGRLWRAWDVAPQKPDLVRPGFEQGWISFETEDDKYRLVPVPPGWHEMPETELRRLLHSARAATLRPAVSEPRRMTANEDK